VLSSGYMAFSQTSSQVLSTFSNLSILPDHSFSVTCSTTLMLCDKSAQALFPLTDSHQYHESVGPRPAGEKVIREQRRRQASPAS
jgi:hypothetical protein